MATTVPTGGTTMVDRLRAQQEIVLMQARAIADQVKKEGRACTDAEQQQIDKLLAQSDSLEERIHQIDHDKDLLQRVNGLTGSRGRGTSAGALFAEASAEFFKSGGHRRTGAWESPTANVPYPSLFATTLTEGAGSGGALVVPDYRPGIIPSPTRPIVVMDLLMPGTTTSNAIVYMAETTFTNAAAPVAEGAAKPESALVFASTTEGVSKIAHYLPVTEELLEDVPAIAAYIDGRLRLGVQLEEDDQLLNGNGIPPNFRGLLNRTGLATTVVQGAGESVADAILRQIAAITITAMVAPTGIVMNPSDWVGQQILKDTTNNYIGPSPFESPTTPTLWGLPVALTTAIVAKTVLVGAFATMAQFFRRSFSVTATNAHQDWFVKNLICVRAEERGALAVYRPSAFGKCTLL